MTDALVVRGRPLGTAAAAVAIAHGRIVAIGTEREVGERAGPSARRIGHADATLIPGFVDAHLHFVALARRRLEIECAGVACPTIGAVLETIRAAAALSPPGTWLRAFGVDEALIGERRLPSRGELDAAAPEHPLRLLHRTGHAALLNGAALRVLGLAESHANGIVYDPGAVLASRVPAASGEPLAAAIREASRELAAAGVTTVHDPTPGQDRAKVASLAEHVMAGRIVQRLRCYGDESALGAVDGIAGDRLRVAGVKLVIEDEDDASAIAARAESADRAGAQLAIHAVEGGALVTALAILASLGPERVRARRHRIEHAALVPPPLVREIAALGATVVTHPLFAEVFAAKYRLEIPTDAEPWLYPMAAWRAAEVPLALGSDAPIAPAAPLRNVAAAVARGFPVDEAIAAHTLGGARAAFDESSLGEIRIGALADLVVLQGDVRTDPASAVVVATLVGGEVVHER